MTSNTLPNAASPSTARRPSPRTPREPHAPRPSDAVADWRARMGTNEAKVIYKERAAMAECVNAATRNRGLQRLLVRELDKVKSIALLFALAHNLARCIALQRVVAGCPPRSPKTTRQTAPVAITSTTTSLTRARQRPKTSSKAPPRRCRQKPASPLHAAQKSKNSRL